MVSVQIESSDAESCDTFHFKFPSHTCAQESEVRREKMESGERGPDTEDSVEGVNVLGPVDRILLEKTCLGQCTIF